MRAKAFVPGHITGFFEVYEDPDPLKAGSRGCGVVLSKGTLTRVEVWEARRGSTEVYVNGAPCDCPVTRDVVDGITRLAGRSYGVRVEHSLELPMKYGLGVSGAGALGTALALNKALELGLSRSECGQIAHEAEVRNRTGLGDVIAELAGGMVLRTKPGAPGVGCVERIPLDREVVVFLVGRGLETREVLLSRDVKEKINAAGKRSYSSFIREKTPENFLRVSLGFAREAGLMDEKVYLAAASLANHGVTASMVMLGNALFTLTREPSEITCLLDYPCFTAKVSNRGVEV